MRIGADPAQSEFRHVGLGDNDGPGRSQPAHHRRVGSRRLGLFGENFGAGAGRLSGDVEQILDADNRTIERPKRHAIGRARIGRISGGTCRAGVNRKAGAAPFPRGVGDARQSLFEPVAAGKRIHANVRDDDGSRRHCRPYTDPAIIGESR